jgi:uncharacterized membrane protein
MHTCFWFTRIIYLLQFSLIFDIILFILNIVDYKKKKKKFFFYLLFIYLFIYYLFTYFAYMRRKEGKRGERAKREI